MQHQDGDGCGKCFLPKRQGRRIPLQHRRLRLGFAREARRQMRGYTRGWSLARRVFAIPPLPRPALRQFQERVRPNPCRTKATESLACGSCAASTTTHKTSSQTDSQKYVQSAARERLAQIGSDHVLFLECDYRRPVQNLAIEEAREFSAVMKQIGRRCTPKDSRAAGRVR